MVDEFKEGQKVEVILSKDWVMVLEVTLRKIVCRTKDYKVIEFYPFELKQID